MSPRVLWGVGLSLLLSLLAIVWLLPSTPPVQSLTGAAVLPGLQEQINAVDRVTVQQAGVADPVELRRDERFWRVQGLSGYPVAMTRLRPVLAALAQAQVIEEKTANPAYFGRLGVQDLDTPGATGQLLSLYAGDAEQWSVLVGDEAQRRDGRYLRRPDQAQSLLSDFDAALPKERLGWVDRRVVDLPAAQLAELQLQHVDGETLTVSKLSADETDFTLQELPAGQAPRSSWSVNGLASALAVLDFDAVVAAANFEGELLSQLRAVRFDGLTVSAELLAAEDAYWLRLSASTPFVATEDQQRDVLEQAAESINQRVQGWVYRIPDDKAEVMLRRLSDILLPEDGEA